MSQPDDVHRTPDGEATLAALMAVVAALPQPTTGTDDVVLDDDDLFVALIEAMPADEVAAFLDTLPEASLTSRLQQQIACAAIAARAVHRNPPSPSARFAPGGAALAVLRTFARRSVADLSHHWHLDAAFVADIERGVHAWYELSFASVEWLAAEAAIPLRLVRQLLRAAADLEVNARLATQSAPASALLRDAAGVSPRRFGEDAVRAGVRAPYEPLLRALEERAP